MGKKKNDIEETVFMNPRTDFGFKKIFGDSEVLTAFLNEVLPDAHIKSVEYRPTEQLGEHDTARKAIYDLLCTDENGKFILIEMQNVQQSYFADRALFYSACMIRNQAPKKKDWDYELKAVYVVSILNFVLLETLEDEEKAVVERVSLVNERTKQTFSDKLKFIYIQLPNFTKTREELENSFDCWMYLLRYLEKFTERPKEFQDYIFKRLFHLAQYKTLNTEEMNAYKKSILEYNDVKNAVLFAAEKGEQRGITIGEQRTLQNIAYQLALIGTPIANIAKVTGLTVETVSDIIRKGSVNSSLTTN